MLNVLVHIRHLEQCLVHGKQYRISYCYYYIIPIINSEKPVITPLTGSKFI